MKPFLLLSCAGALLFAGCQNQSTPTQTALDSTNTTTSAAPAATPRPVIGHVRALNAVPGTGQLSLTADSEKIAAVNYSDVSPFVGISDEKIKISAFGGDGKKVAGPMPLKIKQGDDVTVLVTGVPGDVVLLPWEHEDRAPVADKAKIAFVHSAKALPAVEFKLDGKSFRKNTKFGVATDYVTLAPGSHQFQIVYDRSLEAQPVEIEQPTVVTKDTAGNTVAVEQPTPIRTAIPRSEMVTVTQNADLVAGKVYSVAIFHDQAQTPKIRIIEDVLKAGG